MNHSTRIRTTLAATGAGLLLALSQLPAIASQDVGESRIGTPTMDPGTHCLLQRVDRHYVRCDDLTGAGADAPQWVPEHH